MARTLRFGSRVSTADLEHRIARHVSKRRSPTSFDQQRAAEDAARHMGFTSYAPRHVTFGKRQRTMVELEADRVVDTLLRDQQAAARRRFLEH